MPTDALIRRAEAEEAPAVVEMWLRARASASPAIPPPVHSDADVLAWFEDVVLPHREVWVAASVTGEIRGLLVLDDDWVDQLYVDPDWSSRRLGSGLLRVAKDRRPNGLQLWTFEANHGAHRFYERHGFTAVEATDGDNEEGAADVRYEWRPRSAVRADPPTAGPATSPAVSRPEQTG